MDAIQSGKPNNKPINKPTIWGWCIPSIKMGDFGDYHLECYSQHQFPILQAAPMLIPRRVQCRGDSRYRVCIKPGMQHGEMVNSNKHGETWGVHVIHSWFIADLWRCNWDFVHDLKYGNNLNKLGYNLYNMVKYKPLVSGSPPPSMAPHRADTCWTCSGCFKVFGTRS